MPRTSLSALEILLRQVKADADLDGFPEVRANLKSLIRSLQRQGLDQGEQDIACGRVLNRRFLLMVGPSGALRSADTMGLVIRVEEQNHKGNSALRRAARRGVPMARVRIAPPARVMPRQVEVEQEAGPEPDGEVE